MKSLKIEKDPKEKAS